MRGGISCARARHVFCHAHARREGELSDTIAKVNLVNVHELGSIKTKNPVEVAKHASFMAANMLVVVAKMVREDRRGGGVGKSYVR